jgi:hypothetical protein
MGMAFFLDHDQQVAVDSSPAPCIPLSADIQLHPFPDSSRNADGNHFLLADNSLSGTMDTFVCNGLSFSLAGRAGGGRLHLAEEGVGNPRYMTTPVAGTAFGKGRTIPGPRSATMTAGDVFFYFDLFFDSGGDFL